MGKSETRKDYVTDTWVIFAGERALRPHFTSEKPDDSRKGECPFCPKNSHMVNEVSRIERGGKWSVKSIENKFPILSPIPYINYDRNKKKIFDKPFFRHFPVPGHHEVIIDTRNHTKETYRCKYENTIDLIDMYMSRTSELIKKSGMRYVAIFKNKGGVSGASISHPHSQIISLPFVPKIIKSESKKTCAFCEVVKHERESQRKVYENRTFVVISPYAARFPYELWFLPKRHVRDITGMNEQEKYGLADCIHKVLPAMERLMGDFPYNWTIHQAPKNSDFHFHLELYPRVNKWGGMELGSHVYINTKMPEDAAIEIIKHL